VTDPVAAPQIYFDGVEAMLDDARSRLRRLTPAQAYEELQRGEAVLVDIRPQWQRDAQGEVDPALAPLVVERNHLEWRFDPRSDARLPQAAYDARVLVLCQEGYTSSLAADALVRLGVSRATDVTGGFEAWVEAGLPAVGQPAGD
jgi:rhodanese-related sulfurtransferase